MYVCVVYAHVYAHTGYGCLYVVATGGHWVSCLTTLYLISSKQSLTEPGAGLGSGSPSNPVSAPMVLVLHTWHSHAQLFAPGPHTCIASSINSSTHLSSPAPFLLSLLGQS